MSVALGSFARFGFDRKQVSPGRQCRGALIVLPSDYDRWQPGDPPLQPWPRELAHHGDLRLYTGRPFDGYTGFEVTYICDTCRQWGGMCSPTGDPENLACLAARILAGRPCVTAEPPPPASAHVGRLGRP